MTLPSCFYNLSSGPFPVPPDPGGLSFVVIGAPPPLEFRMLYLSKSPPNPSGPPSPGGGGSPSPGGNPGGANGDAPG